MQAPCRAGCVWAAGGGRRQYAYCLLPVPVLDFKKSQKFKLASWLRALVPEAAGGQDDQKSLSH